ncbi:hypothetical protein B4099_3299 [Heyndrickxia coagulans]|uniref:Uncharacterized protein n=1 Tax=Heyndrickxia coagulans TaxID=1398 RepID=A0A150KB77_HEYCO|nr:hypothetical protein B4099_3299 [Heyndrickxia coagulans]
MQNSPVSFIHIGIALIIYYERSRLQYVSIFSGIRSGRMKGLFIRSGQRDA